nr:MAG TPA_asm: zinc finger domain protein [Caudoviricetes sp.]
MWSGFFCFHPIKAPFKCPYSKKALSRLIRSYPLLVSRRN